MTQDHDYVTVLDRIATNSMMRRELLWLRAKETDDEETVLDLEQVEPTLAARMQQLVAQFRARGGRLETDAERREGFARLYHQRFEELANEVRRGHP